MMKNKCMKGIITCIYGISTISPMEKPLMKAKNDEVIRILNKIGELPESICDFYKPSKEYR